MIKKPKQNGKGKNFSDAAVNLHAAATSSQGLGISNKLAKVRINQVLPKANDQFHAHY